MAIEKMKPFLNYDHHVKNLRHVVELIKLINNLHVVLVTTNLSYDYDGGSLIAEGCLSTIYV